MGFTAKLRGSVGRSFVFYILLFSSVAALAGTSVQLFFEYKRDISTIKKTAEQIEKSHKSTISQALWTYDGLILESQLQGIHTLPGVLYACIKKGDRILKETGTGHLDEKVISYQYDLFYQARHKTLALGTLEVKISLSDVYDRLWDRVVLILFTQTLKTFVVSVFILFLFHMIVGRHLQSMADFATSINLNNLENKLILNRKKARHKRYDELALVESALNNMRRQLLDDITNRKQAEEERKKLENQLRQSQKMDAVGRLAGGVAHDFNNMLSVILGHTEMIREEVDPALDINTDLDEIYSAARRSADLTRQLLAFARKQTISPKILNFNETVSGMINMLTRVIGEQIDLSWRPGPHLGQVKMDPGQVDQILVNLCVNAKDAIHGVGKIIIETDNVTFDQNDCSEHTFFLEGDYILLSVSDDGTGMNKETLKNIFEPFFTTKDQGKGTGLGLAMVYGVVKQNNGFIDVYSEPGQGTTIKIYFPQYSGSGVLSQETEAIAHTETGKETILLVEDDPSILRMTKIMIERMGYNVISSSMPGQAIELARRYDGDIHLLLTDVIMPEMNGRDLEKNLLSLYPGLKRLFMSGYTADVIAHHGVLDPGINFIQKPFSKITLSRKIKDALI